MTSPERQRTNAVVGVLAGVVLIAFTIWTAAKNDMDGTAWAGAALSLVVGTVCAATGLTRLRRPPS